MSPETPDQHASQEQSIKERKRELFDGEAGPVLPEEHRESFPNYLRDTPAAPLSGLVKGLLWSSGVLVLLLFVAALLSGRGPRVRRPAPPKKAASPRGAAVMPAIALRPTGPGGAREPVPAAPEREWGAAGTGPEG